MAAILCLVSPASIASTQSAAGEPPVIVATIAPLHSLVSSLVSGTRPAHLLLANSTSAHSYAMKPSDAKHLAKADIIVQVGPAMEGFLQKTIASVASTAELISAANTDGTRLLAVRQFSDHDGDHENHGSVSVGDAYDPHIWLDPLNNQAWINELASRLKQNDPVNAEIYEKNRLALNERLRLLDSSIAETLAPLAGQRFIAQHDSYQYLENRYGMGVVGVMLDTHEQRMGVASLRKLKQRAKQQQARCIVTAPGSTTSVLESISGLAKIQRIEIDVLGIHLQPGPELYFELMLGIAKQLAECLGSSDQQ